MISLLRAEALKLRRSLVLLVAATPPLMVFALGFLVTASDNGPDMWQMQIMSGSAIWGFFLLPMSAIGLTALQAQLEHAPNTWSHTLALPRPKWQVFLAKAICAQLILAIVSLLVMIAGILSTLAGLPFSETGSMTDELDWGLALSLYARMYVAAVFVTALQWLIATRFRSFAVAVSVGIGGTFVAVAATSSKWGLYFPWLMPVNILASDPERANLALAYGLGGGVLVYALGIVWLARRDWA